MTTFCLFQTYPCWTCDVSLVQYIYELLCDFNLVKCCAPFTLSVSHHPFNQLTLFLIHTI